MYLGEKALENKEARLVLQDKMYELGFPDYELKVFGQHQIEFVFKFI